MCRPKKTSKLRVTGLCAENSPGPVNSPHKGPVTRKMFPFDDVIMRYHTKTKHRKVRSVCIIHMMTSSNGNIFRVTGHLCGEFTGDRWIPRTKPVTRSFDIFFDLRLNKRLSKQSWGWWFETLSRLLWSHCNAWGVCTTHVMLNYVCNVFARKS